MIGHLTKPVLVLNLKRNIMCRRVVDTLENCVYELDYLLLKIEILQYRGLGKLHVEIDRLAGIGRGDDNTE